MNGDYNLAYGTHATPADGRCAMEWVSYLAGEPHSDQPVCVSPVVRALCVALNDGLDEQPRQRLRPYLARTIGTAGDGFDPARSWLAMDWLIRTYAPAWLSPAGLDQAARSLSELPPILDEAGLHGAMPRLQDARRQSQEALRAARTPPWAIARAAARETAWYCAGAAAWAGARVAVGDIAGDQARAHAKAVGGEAAAVIAANALRAKPPQGGRAAAKQAAMAALAPTVERLHESVVDLLDRMLPTEPVEIPAGSTIPAARAIFTTSV